MFYIKEQKKGSHSDKNFQGVIHHKLFKVTFCVTHICGNMNINIQNVMNNYSGCVFMLFDILIHILKPLAGILGFIIYKNTE